MVADGYKQTEIGVVPEDWEVVKIKDFTDGTAGGTPSTKIPSYWGGGIRWMSSGELNNKIIFDVEGRITEEGLSNSSTKMIPKNCILIGLAGQGKTRGTVAINRVELCTNQSIAAIYPNEKYYISEYLYYNMENRYEELRAMSTGDGGRGGLNLTILRNYPLALPKIQEQKAIATALSDTDALIDALEKLIAKKEDIKTGTMQELLTGNKRLDGFSEEWVEQVLGDYVSITSGDSPSKFSFHDKGMPYYKVEQLNYSTKYLVDKTPYFIKNNAKKVSSNSIIFPKRGAAIFLNKIRLLASDAFFDTNLMALTTNDKLSYEFLFYVLSYIGLEHVADTTSVPQINNKHINPFVIPFPALDEQEAIATILSDMDKEIETLKSKLSKLKAIKEGMMQELLSGKTRLLGGENYD